MTEIKDAVLAAVRRFTDQLREVDRGFRRAGRTVPGAEEKDAVAAAFWSMIRVIDRHDEGSPRNGSSEALRRRCREELGPWLFRSRYFNRSFSKPHGYAGDYRIVEWMYDMEDDRCDDPTQPALVNCLDHIYYFPEECLRALVDVLRNFVMSAAAIVPNYDAFVKVLYEAQLFGPRLYVRNVAKPALAALGVTSVKAIETGILRSRETPGPDWGSARRPVPEGCEFEIVESAVRRLFERFRRYEDETGLSAVQPTRFVRYSWSADAGARPVGASAAETSGGTR